MKMNTNNMKQPFKFKFVLNYIYLPLKKVDKELQKHSFGAQCLETYPIYDLTKCECDHTNLYKSCMCTPHP